VEVEEEFGLRSASMPHGGDASNINSFSDVFALQGVSSPSDNARLHPDPPVLSAAAVMEDGDDITALQDIPTITRSSSPFATARPSSTLLLRPRSHRGGGSGSIRGSSSSSFGGNSGSGGSSDAAGRGVGGAASGGRYSSRATGAGAMAALSGLDDDEPLLFTMSELGAQQQGQSQCLGSGSGPSPNRNADSSPAHERRSAAGGGGITRQ